jgi:hypothetical protein
MVLIRAKILMLKIGMERMYKNYHKDLKKMNEQQTSQKIPKFPSDSMFEWDPFKGTTQKRV